MSDLTATSCSSCGNQRSNNGCGSWIWILILLFFCNGNNGGLFNLGNNGCGGDCDDNNGCEWLIILLVLFSCCGNNSRSCGC